MALRKCGQCQRGIAPGMAGRRVIDPCPLKVDARGEYNECLPCIDGWRERAALIADGCRLTQPQAEAEATRQLKGALDNAERKQRSLF